MEPLLAEPSPAAPGAETVAVLRGAPEPLHGGPLALLRFMRANHMLTLRYGRLLCRFVWLKLRFGSRLKTEGVCFVCPQVSLEMDGQTRTGAKDSGTLTRIRCAGMAPRIRNRAAA